MLELHKPSGVKLGVKARSTCTAPPCRLSSQAPSPSCRPVERSGPPPATPRMRPHNRFGKILVTKKCAGRLFSQLFSHVSNIAIRSFGTTGWFCPRVVGSGNSEESSSFLSAAGAGFFLRAESEDAALLLARRGGRERSLLQCHREANMSAVMSPPGSKPATPSGSTGGSTLGRTAAAPGMSTLVRDPINEGEPFQSAPTPHNCNFIQLQVPSVSPSHS